MPTHPYTQQFCASVYHGRGYYRYTLWYTEHDSGHPYQAARSTAVLISAGLSPRIRYSAEGVCRDE